MDPNSGRIYTEDEMVALDPDSRARLVEMRGDLADVERIGRAVANLNRQERRAANRRAGLRSNGDPK